MGAYLSTPITDKDTSDGVSASTHWGISSMQGWRRTMEDAHLATTHEEEGTEIGIFGVFDGHGGGEVAKFCSAHLAEELCQLESFQQGNVGEGLIQAFHRMDEMLRLPEFSQELEGYRGAGKGEGSGNGNNGGSGGGGSAPPPPSGVSSRQSTGASGSSEPGKDGPSAEQQQTLDVMKRILEIKRMVTEGASGNSSSGASPGGSRPGAPGGRVSSSSGRGEGDEGKFVKPASGGEGEPVGEQCGQVGCTAVVAVLKGGELYVANAGDSRAVLGRGAQAVALSVDHKPASTTEKNRITNAGGFVSEVGGVTRVNGNLNLSRAIGDLRYKGNSDVQRDAQIITAQPDVRRVSITPEDRFFLLACDGVWDVMSNQQAVDFVNERLDQGMSVGVICEEMLDHCLAKNPKEARGIGCDNMTAQVVVFRKSAAPAAPEASAKG
mmetsp:Transcript_17737/g.53424  ORF Transcript_17737/g.53424 Transcript_17737/m.53424 type:complete len:437 (-) Transcript_17737:987-2297(-)